MDHSTKRGVLCSLVTYKNPDYWIVRFFCWITEFHIGEDNEDFWLNFVILWLVWSIIPNVLPRALRLLAPRTGLLHPQLLVVLLV